MTKRSCDNRVMVYMGLMHHRHSWQCSSVDYLSLHHVCCCAVQLLDSRLHAAESGGSQPLASLDSQLAEVEDVVSYVSDLLSLGKSGMA